MKRTSIIFFGDFISFVLAFVILAFLRLSGQNDLASASNHILPFLILYFSWALVFYMFGLYDLLSIKPTIPYLKRWAIALLCSFGVGIILFYFVPIFGISPKLNLIIQIILFGIFSFSFRRIIYTLFSKTITQPAILIGESSYLLELEKNIKINPQVGIHIIHHFKYLNDMDIDLGKIKNLVIIIDKNIGFKSDDILNLYRKNIEILDTAKAYEKYLTKIPVEYIDLSFVIEEVNTKKDIFYQIISWFLDKLFAILTLIITSPLLLIGIIARAIEDGRPIFIKQQRIGLNGKIFNIYKLRSMIALSPDGSAETNGPVWATGKDDPRITKVGKVIRKLHIDEIPQMINVLAGDISLIGPRPERPEFVEMLSKDIPYYSFRHIVKPGFTGWAQIKYHYANSVLSSKEKFKYDLYYVKNRNIFMDFGICLRTIQIIFTH